MDVKPLIWRRVSQIKATGDFRYPDDLQILAEAILDLRSAVLALEEAIDDLQEDLKELETDLDLLKGELR